MAVFHCPDTVPNVNCMLRLCDCRLQQRITMLQAMVDSPEEAEGWDAPQGERPTSAGGTMTSSSLHRILQVTIPYMLRGTVVSNMLSGMTGAKPIVDLIPPISIKGPWACCIMHACNSLQPCVAADSSFQFTLVTTSIC